MSRHNTDQKEAELFCQVCTAMWGPHFRQPAAIELNVEFNTLRNWDRGSSRIPPSVWAELLTIADKRWRDIQAAVASVRELIA